MSGRLPILVIAVLALSGYTASSLSVGQSKLTSKATVQAMEKVYARSERTRSMAMAATMKSMSHQQAWKVLERSNFTSPALMEISAQLNGKRSQLRQPKGYAGGVDAALNLTNDMMYQAWEKYDREILKCTEYYEAQCSLMEAARSEIETANFYSTQTRATLLRAREESDRCSRDIPLNRAALDNHKMKCSTEIQQMEKSQEEMRGDIEVMDAILNMTDCNSDSKSFIETKKVALLRCQDHCGRKFVTFNHDKLKQAVRQLHSSVSHKLMRDSFADLFEGAESTESLESLQLASSSNTRDYNTTQVDEDAPRTDVPVNPCSRNDVPSPYSQRTMVGKRGNKCTTSKLKTPQCNKLRGRFVVIQSGMQDEFESLVDDMQRLRKRCKETEETLQTQIDSDVAQGENAEQELAVATTKEVQYGEQGRLADTLHREQEKDLRKQMADCSANYVIFEQEICALKKIRGEIQKMSTVKDLPEDCEVGAWTSEGCSQECKHEGSPDGEEKLTRDVEPGGEYGVKCLPEVAIRKCNLHHCPINCKLSDWNEWSKCSAQCGGGVKLRLREVQIASRYHGDSCGETIETVNCNMQSCDQDCVLGDWTSWSQCSKACDGGTQQRKKYIRSPAVGLGTCPNFRDERRLQRKECNDHKCKCSDHMHDPKEYPSCKKLPRCCDGFTGLGYTKTAVRCYPESWAKSLALQEKCGDQSVVMHCKEKIDIVLEIDGSGSLGETGWVAEKRAAILFVEAFSGVGAQAQISVIQFSGPNTWAGVKRCLRPGALQNIDKDCNIKTESHLTDDMKTVKNAITNSKHQGGSTLTNMALKSAKSELALGRSDAQSVVIVFTDGKPTTYRRTLSAAESLKKQARLLFVPVIQFAPLKFIKSLASDPPENNVIIVNDFSILARPVITNHVIADICPSAS